MLSRDEARASLVLAIELGPAPWVARELALTLARLEFGAGAREARRAFVADSNMRAFYRLEARREARL